MATKTAQASEKPKSEPFSGPEGNRLPADLDDDLADMPLAHHRRMAVLGQQHRELAGTQRIVGLRLVVEELDVLLRIERPQRLPKVLALAPAERLLRTRDEDLNVDIGVVHLQFGIGPALEVHVHHIDENIPSVEFVDARLHAGPVGRGDEREGPFEPRVERMIQRAVFQRIENHGITGVCKRRRRPFPDGGIQR